MVKNQKDELIPKDWTLEKSNKEGFEFNLSRNKSVGPKLLVIGSALYYPRVLPQELISNFEIVCIDHRGFAKRLSEKEEEESEYKSSLVTEDIEFFRKKLVWDSFILLGHSGHGYMALQYALKYQKNIQKLILVSTGPSHGSPLLQRNEYFNTNASKDRKEKHKELLIRFESKLKKDPQNFFALYCQSQDALGFYDLNMDSLPFWEGINTNKLAFDHLFGKEFAEIDITKILNQLEIPLQIGMGRFDFQVAPYYTWDSILKYYPQIRMKIFEKSAHLPFYEEPVEFLNWILS